MSDTETSTNLLIQLKEASQGLVYLSESESSFEVFIWEGQASDGLTPEQVAQQTGHPADASVQVMELSEFFKPTSGWFGLEEQEIADRFKTLENTLASNLTNIKVYRVGHIEIDVYIVGQHANDLIGISTKVIET